MSDGRDTVTPLPRERFWTVDAMRMAGRRSDIHGLVEFDVADGAPAARFR